MAIRARIAVSLKPSDIAWIVLAIWVIGWDMAVEEEELLSRACDRYHEHHPWLTRAVITITAAHLLRLLPEQFDPFHITAKHRPWRKPDPFRRNMSLTVTSHTSRTITP